MNQIYSSDYYERMGLHDHASQEEIRSRFASLVAIYPPNQKQKEYIQLREAYDVLKDPESRSKYDGLRTHRPKIKRLNSELEEAQKNGDWIHAQRCLKELIVLQPNVASLHNSLGDMFFNAQQFPQAVIEYEIASKLDPFEVFYLINIGRAYRKLENYITAENYYLQAMKKDEGNLLVPRDLASMYWLDMERKAEATKLLEDAIERDGVLDIQDFYFIFDLLRFHAIDNRIDQMKKRLNQISAVSLNQTNKDLVSTHLFELIDFCFSIIKLEPVAVLYEYLGKQNQNFHLLDSSKILKEAVLFSSDNSNPEPLSFFIQLMAAAYCTGETHDVWEKARDMIQPLLLFCSTYPDGIEYKNSLIKIKQSFPKLYEAQRKAFDLLINSTYKHHNAPCPNCNKNVLCNYGIYGDYICPHCNQKINYSGSGYRKNIINSGATNAGGCLVSILGLPFFITLIAALILLAVSLF